MIKDDWDIYWHTYFKMKNVPEEVMPDHISAYTEYWFEPGFRICCGHAINDMYVYNIERYKLTDGSLHDIIQGLNKFESWLEKNYIAKPNE